MTIGLPMVPSGVTPTTTTPDLSVMIIGGGIAGTQAALDLAAAGVKVVLVERGPSIGGVMAALDKNFPTLDCSICIEAPKLSEVAEAGNIEVLAQAEVTACDELAPETLGGGSPGYRITISRKGGFVTDGCTRCDLCMEACPILIPNEFDAGMASRKAIYTPFPQAVPGPYILNMDECVNDPPVLLQCTRCYDACPPGVIDFDLPAQETLVREVSSIIVATGFETLKGEELPEYGYGSHPDILTAMEFERLLSSAGPSGGEILCPSDGRHAKSVAFVLCAGSRDQRHLAYCSRFCCMYSIKEAVQAVDHGVQEVSILYMDIRAFGKGFERFYERAKDEGVDFIHGRPGRVWATAGGIRVRYEDTDGGLKQELQADIVVLATGARAPQGLDTLAEILGVPLGEDGFLAGGPPDDPLALGRPGIFAAGSAMGPKDIPDSVTEASAAAARAEERIRTREWAEFEMGEPIDVSGEVRVGVFICDCGSNIAGVIDVPTAVEHARTQPNVVYAEEVRFACAGNTQADIAATIQREGLTRLVIAACSPKTHEGTFKRVCMKAGLNPYLLEMSNLRNHNSWVHKESKEMATRKAFDMVNMAIEKASLLQPLEIKEQPMIQTALVVGGGVAGISAAVSLARQGFPVHLVEKADRLGGLVNHNPRLQDTLAKMVAQVAEAGVHIHLGKTVAQIDGHIGNFHARLSDDVIVDAGVVIIATGGEPRGAGLLAKQTGVRVITNLTLEHEFRDGAVAGDRITLVGCVGSRDLERECSRYCCAAMVEQALDLVNLGKQVRILYRDLRTFGRGEEELYRDAAAAGVVFFRLPDRPVDETVRVEEGQVVFMDLNLGSEAILPTDTLVLECGLQATEENVSKMLKVTRAPDGFLLEMHPKLGPVEAGNPGIYLAGLVQAPKGIGEAIAQGLATAGKAATLLAKDVVAKEPLTAQIDPELCNGCSRCVSACPFGAIQLLETTDGKLAEVIAAACAGCGNCAAECFRGAITMPYFTDEQILAQIDAALVDDPEDKVLLFACNWCSYAGADQAGIEKLQYPGESRIIRTMCSGRISDAFIARAFEKEAGAVLVTGCHPGDCHYITANDWTAKRFKRWQKKWARKGIAEERLQLKWISAAEGKEFAAKLREMHDVLERHHEALVKARAGSEA